MRRAVTAVVAAGMLVAGAGPAAAGLRITKIAFNPKGEDTGTNKHLNKEFVTITNTGSKAKKRHSLP